MSAKETWQQGRIARTEDIAPTIRLFEIEVEGGAEPWQPGAHLGVRVLCDGRKEDRHYSLLDLGSDDGRYRIAVRRADSGLGGSRYMWALAAGDTVEITRPQDDFELELDAPAYVMLAGGIGVTPLLSMARKVSRRGTPLEFHYAVRNRADAVFAELLREWLGDRLYLHVSAEGTRLDVAALVAGSRVDAELYLCGPVGMLDSARAAWRVAGRAPEKLRFESFGSGGHYANQSFTVSLPRYGVELEVPAQQSLLSAIEEAGIEVLSGCRRGECGLCAVDVLACDTSLDHRDVFLSSGEKGEGKRMCSCVSRPVGGRLVIDTDYRGREMPAAA
jgi:vanillate O-demethylase ferredoxin subunit